MQLVKISPSMSCRESKRATEATATFHSIYLYSFAFSALSSTSLTPLQRSKQLQSCVSSASSITITVSAHLTAPTPITIPYQAGTPSARRSGRQTRCSPLLTFPRLLPCPPGPGPRPKVLPLLVLACSCRLLVSIPPTCSPLAFGLPK